ncbi:MAG: ankyrin repeat domain-containing protein, partial [Limisphaerales bacterium]
MKATTVWTLGCAVVFLSALLLFLNAPKPEPLWRAIAVGDTQAVEKVLHADPSLANKPFRFGRRTPLSQAVISANAKGMIDVFVAHGADINARSGGFSLTPLQDAVWSGRVEAVKALLAHKPEVNAVNPDNMTALHYAISVYMDAVFSGSTNNVGREMMELLLANGADINQGHPILMDAVHYAANAGLVEFLLSKGANVNVQQSHGGETALNMAIISGNKATLQLILQHNPNLRLVGGNYGTAMATAVELGRLDFALLIEEHALQSRSNRVALAAAQGTPDELRGLLQKSPQAISRKDDLGFTPLHYAAAVGRRDSAEMLLAAGAEVNAADASGLRPLEWAAFSGRLPLVELLVERGGHDPKTAL